MVGDGIIGAGTVGDITIRFGAHLTMGITTAGPIIDHIDMVDITAILTDHAIMDTIVIIAQGFLIVQVDEEAIPPIEEPLVPLA